MNLTHTKEKNRKEAEKSSDKDGKALYKIMSNAVYCKNIENVRNRIDVEFVSNKKDFLKRTSKPSFMSYKIFGNGLIAICKGAYQTSIHWDVYLRIEQNIMYEFHYDYIKDKYGNNSGI